MHLTHCSGANGVCEWFCRLVPAKHAAVTVSTDGQDKRETFGQRPWREELTALVAFACLVTIAAPVAWGLFKQVQMPRLRECAIAAPFAAWFIVGLVFLILSWPKIMFFQAVEAGDLDAVKTGLRTHPEWLTAHELSLDRNTPLGVAVRAGREEVVAWLLEKGAPLNPDVNVPPLVLAASRGRTPIGRMLLEHGASPDQVGFRHDNPAIAIAANFGHPRFVRLLVDWGAEIEATDIGGDTALMDASKRGQVECVEVLLDAGADVNASNRFAETALHQAARNGHTAVVKVLLAHGAEVNVRARGHTPLFVAASGGHADTVRALLEDGADPTTVALEYVTDRESRRLIKSAKSAPREQ